MVHSFRFNDYVFKGDVGELIHTDASGVKTTTRLQPQPSKLLTILLNNYPNVVSREEIQGSIWPEVHVDFEGSIHFCIRQIRTVLNDDAAQPKFIETIPRRGYRWISDVEPLSAQEVHDFHLKSLTHGNKRPFLKRFWSVGLISLVLIFFLLRSLLNYPEISATTTESNKMRIAIMPFQPETDSNDFINNSIAIRLLEELTSEYSDEFEVVGPTTTIDFKGNAFQENLRHYHIDYVINGRFSIVENRSRVLVELIRASDGAHVWVQPFYSSASEDSILLMIHSGLLGLLSEKKASSL